MGTYVGRMWWRYLETLSRYVSAGTEGKYERIESKVFAAQFSAIFDFWILNTKSLHFLIAVSWS
jgi:hypothetical protein